jgi:hypothetical protein
MTLFAIAGLQLVCGLAAVAIIPEQLAGGPVAKQAMPIMAGMILFIGLIYAGLGLWAQFQPLPAAVIGLTVYLVVFVLDLVGNPELVGRGLIVKVAIMAALAKCISSAAKSSNNNRWS